MTSIMKVSLALFMAAFVSAPAIAAEVAAPAAPAVPAVETPATPDMGSILKGKAAEAIDKGTSKGADELKKSLGITKGKDAQAKEGEAVDVTQETVTVETPQGAAQETTITVAPAEEGAPAPEAAQPK